MATKVNTKKAGTKKASTKKVEKAPVETKTVEQPKSTEPESVYVDEQGVVRVPERLKQMAQAELAKDEAREHKKYNKIQSLRTFKYEVYYGDASHEPGHHGEKQKEFKNLQTAINYIAKEAKFFVEEGIERECYSIVLDEKLIAEY
jgi:hypothetical protein